MELKEACEILEVNEQDSLDIIKKKYRELSKKYHPDLYQNQNNEILKIIEKNYKKINEAYEFFKNREEKNEINNYTEEIITNVKIVEDDLGREVFLNSITLIPITGTVAYRTQRGLGAGKVKSGYQEGEWCYLGEEKELVSTREYFNSVLNGKLTLYEDEMYYKDGILHGIRKSYGYKEIEISKEMGLSKEEEFDYGKLIFLKEYNIKNGKIEKRVSYENEKVISIKDIEIFYDNGGHKQGKIRLYYESKYEDVYLNDGKIYSWSDIHYNTGKIEKKIYNYGRELKEDFNSILYNDSFEDIYGLDYIKDGKTYKFDVAENEFLYYKYLKDIHRLETSTSVKLCSYNNRIDILNEIFSRIRKEIMAWNNKIELNHIDINRAECNKDNSDLLRELKPENFEDFALKIRERAIEFKLQDLEEYYNDKINNSLNNTSTCLKISGNIFSEVTKIFKEELFPEVNVQAYSPEWTIEFWESVFKEANTKDFISNDLLRILNVVMRNDTLKIAMINIYIGLKYNLIDFVKYILKKIKKIENKDREIPILILEIFNLKKIKYYPELIEILEFLINNTYEINLIKNLEELQKNYEKISIFLENITNKNSVFHYFNKKTKDLEGILSQIENEIKNIKKELAEKNKIILEKKVEEAKKNLEEVYPLIFYFQPKRENSNKIFEYIYQLEKKLNFLLTDDKIYLSKEQIKKLQLLYILKNNLYKCYDYYKDILLLVNSECEEAKKRKNSSQAIIGFIGSILAIICMFLSFGFVIGIVSVIVAPIVIGIIVGLYSNLIRRAGERDFNKLNQEKKILEGIEYNLGNLKKVLITYEDDLEKSFNEIDEVKSEKKVSEIPSIIKNENLTYAETTTKNKKNYRNFLIILILGLIFGLSIFTTFNKKEKINYQKGYIVKLDNFLVEEIQDFTSLEIDSFKKFVNNNVNEKKFQKNSYNIVEFYQSGRVKRIGQEGFEVIELEDKSNWAELEKGIEELDEHLNNIGCYYYFGEYCLANEWILIAEKLNKNKTKEDKANIELYEKKIYNLNTKVSIYNIIGFKLQEINNN